MGQKYGTVRAEIAGHGQYETTAVALDELISEHWSKSRATLIKDVKEMQGDQAYDCHGLSRIELILIIAELTGLAIN